MTLVEFVPPVKHPLWKLCLQMGITDVIVKVNPTLTGLPDPWRHETLKKIVDGLAADGLRVVGLEGDPFDMSPIKQFGESGRGEPERETALEHYRELLESMAKLDIHLLCYNFMVGTGWARTGVREGRGGAKATYFSLKETPKAELKLTKEQVWANYEHFLKAVMPTAEKAGVRMGLHPDDPCLPELGGYARIFETVADYDRAYAIYPSESNAVTYCQANFKLMGADLVETAKHFGKRIAFIHVRDVEGDKNDFTELFHDQGTTDQFGLMRTYRTLGLDVPVRGDHVPEMEGDRKLVADAIPGYFNLGRLFANGYLKALLRGTALGLAAIAFAFPAGAIDVDDQIRYCAAFEMPLYEKVREMGFNHLSAYATSFAYNYETDTFENLDRKTLSTLATHCAADGIEFSVTFPGGRFKPDTTSFAPLQRDGKPFVRTGSGKKVKPCIDASHPAYREILVKAAHAVAKECASLHSPAFAGVRGLEEVRLWSQPSFAARNRAAYRAFSGHDIPDEVQSKLCVPWSKVPDMPADRLVDGAYPLLNYYRWFWKTGDGWADANDLASETIQSHFEKPLMTLYMPGRRMPALWGIGGRKSTHLGDWFYLYPFPFTISAKIAELQANARGTGAKVIATVDGIFKSDDTLPAEKAPNPLPEWYEKCKKRRYPTIPPAWMSEAYWLMLAKRTDGVGLSIAPAVFGRAPGSKYWAEKTNDGAAPVVEKVMKEVATPLGPLLKNMPEHAPEVAVFESNAGLIFTGRARYGWTMRVNRLADYLTAANLPPYVFFEEELETTGLPPSVKVVFLPECDVLTKSSAEKLAALRARGVRLIGEPTLAPGLKADATMPGAEHPLYTTDGTLKGAESDRTVREFAAQLRALADFKPYADSDNPWILVSARSCGSADLVFAVNDKRAAGDYIGGWGTMLDDAVPNAGKVTVRRAAGAVYDLVRHAKVEFAVEDGQTVIPVSYETTDGRALLVTARPLAPLKAGVRDGWLAVGSDDADVMVPFGVLDAEGKALAYGVLRNGRWKRALPAGAAKVLNLATGETTAICGAADGGERLEICMSGFSEAVRTEKGVLDLKAIGADSASGIPWTDRATLDLFEKHGLKAVVNGLPNWFGGKTELVGKMAELHPLSEFEAAAATWRMHPAIREVVVGDEPGKPDFAHYGKVFDLVREKMPGAVPNVPIFPDYGSHIARGDAEAKVQMGTDSYEDYVRSFCALVPSATSLKVDFYPYSAPAEKRAEYFKRRFSTMDVAARTAREFGKRLCLYVQCNSVFKDFKMTLPRMRYLAFTSLAYGARELNFTCYTPSWWKHNILDKKGRRTERYEMVRQLISELRAFDRAYMRFATTGTKVVGTFPAVTALGTLSAEDGGRLVVGEMTSPAGERALCIAGADDPEGANMRVRRLTLKGADAIRVLTREGPVTPEKDAAGDWRLDLPSDGILLVISRK